MIKNIISLQIIILISLCIDSYCCKCEKLSLAEHYNNSGLIFIGDLIEINDSSMIKCGNVPVKTQRLIFKTNEILKGTCDTIIQLYLLETGCSSSFTKKGMYLIFAFKTNKRTFIYECPFLRNHFIVKNSICDLTRIYDEELKPDIELMRLFKKDNKLLENELLRGNRNKVKKEDYIDKELDSLKTILNKSE